MLADWINKKYLEKPYLVKLNKFYKTAKPFPHIQLKDLIRKEVFKKLYDALTNVEFLRKESDLFSYNQTNDLTDSNEPVIKEFYDLLKSREFKDWLDEITGELIYYGKIDGFGASYTNTDHLLCHDDKYQQRKIAYILYMNSLKPTQGGRLIFYTDKKGHPYKKVKTYAPEQNTLILFTVTQKTWHEVEEVTTNASRLTIGGWFYD